MKKKNTYLLFPVALSFLLACSADVGYAPDKDYSGTTPEYNAKNLGDLPDCDSKHEGLVVHVNYYPSHDYACSEGYWVALGQSTTDKKLPDVHETSDEAVALHEKFKNVESVQILDTRDNKVYKAIVLGDLVWMAENLDYETRYSRTNPQCEDLGIKCGRYYMWDDAAYGNDDYSSVCLPGMRLPTEEDVDKLVEFIGGVSNGYVLKSKSYWEESEDAPLGTDELGFNAYPAGYKRSSRNYFEYFGTETVFWTDISNGYHSSLTLSLYSHNSILGTNWGPDWDNYMNVRCVGDL